MFESRRVSHQEAEPKEEKLYSDAELSEFDRITNDLSSLNQLERIAARLEIQKFIAKHGREKCDAMFEVLKAKDKKRATNRG